MKSINIRPTWLAVVRIARRVIEGSKSKQAVEDMWLELERMGHALDQAQQPRKSGQRVRA